MIEFNTFERGDKTYTYLKVEMGKAPFLLVKGQKGYIMCGYMNLEAATKLGDLGVRVSGVSDLNTVLESKVAGCTPAAKEAGIEEGDRVSDIIHLI
ncbi:hypothetical protein IX51_05745 [uncultured archaeon]|nr:hypothetical protein IX51_05745 [uncultured archaeon]HKJ97209.1 DUF1805 domain-containing protein [Thermoplasmataceae archaeon]